MAGFENSQWNSLQLLAWVYLRDRALVDELGASGPDRTIWTEQNLPDGTRRLVPTSAPKPSSLRIDLVAAERGAGTIMPAPGPLPQHDPSNFEPAVPSPPSKRFTGAFASRVDAEADILHRLRVGALPVTGRGGGQG